MLGHPRFLALTPASNPLVSIQFVFWNLLLRSTHCECKPATCSPISKTCPGKCIESPRIQKVERNTRKHRLLCSCWCLSQMIYKLWWIVLGIALKNRKLSSLRTQYSQSCTHFLFGNNFLSHSSTSYAWMPARDGLRSIARLQVKHISRMARRNQLCWLSGSGISHWAGLELPSIGLWSQIDSRRNRFSRNQARTDQTLRWCFCRSDFWWLRLALWRALGRRRVQCCSLRYLSEKRSHPRLPKLVLMNPWSRLVFCLQGQFQCQGSTRFAGGP